MQTVGSAIRSVKGISKEEVFSYWSDVDNWSKWNDDIIKAQLDGTFEAGNHFMLYPKKGPKVKIMIKEVVPNHSFTDCTIFPLAKMYGIHEIDEKDGTLTIKATIMIEGMLSFLWKKIVAQDIADSLGADMDKMIALIEDEKK